MTPNTTQNGASQTNGARLERTFMTERVQSAHIVVNFRLTGQGEMEALQNVRTETRYAREVVYLLPHHSAWNCAICPHFWVDVLSDRSQNELIKTEMILGQTGVIPNEAG